MKPGRLVATVATLLVALGTAGIAQAQPAPPAPPAPPPAIDADGTYAVGLDIAPGTYSSAGPTENGTCYWKRTSGEEMVDNALTKKTQVVRIEPGDTSFTTNGCQPWRLTDAAPPPATAPGDLLGQVGAFLGPAILFGPR